MSGQARAGITSIVQKVLKISQIIQAETSMVAKSPGLHSMVRLPLGARKRWVSRTPRAVRPIAQRARAKFRLRYQVMRPCKHHRPTIMRGA